MRRPGFHFSSQHRHTMLNLLVIDSGKFQHVIECFFDAERQRNALRGGEMTEERAVTRLMIFNVVEDQRRGIGWMLAIEHVDDGAISRFQSTFSSVVSSPRWSILSSQPRRPC